MSRRRILVLAAATVLIGLLVVVARRPHTVSVPLHTLRLNGDAWGVRFSPDGKTLAVGGSDGNIQLIDVATWRVRHILSGPGEWMYFSRDGTAMYAVGRKDANGGNISLKRWGTSTWQVTQNLFIQERPVALSTDLQTLVAPVPKAGAFRVWNLTTGKVERTISGPGKSGYSVEASFSPDGKMLAVGSMDGTVHLWDTRQWKIVRSWKYQADDEEPVEFSPDGKTLAVGGGEGHVDLLNPATGDTEHSLSVETTVPYILTYSPDSCYLLTKGNDIVQTSYGRQWQSTERVKLWNVRSGREIATLGGVSSVSPTVFSRDGKLLVTGDTETVLWETATGRELCRFVTGDERGPVLSTALSPDKTLLADGSVYGTVRLWRIPPQ